MSPAASNHLLVPLLLLLLLLSTDPANASSSSKDASGSRKSADLACSACRVVYRAILTTDAAKALVSGSSATVERDKAKLEQLSNAVERVCRHLPIHARMQHQDMPDRWGIVPVTREDGKPVDTARVDADPGLANWLRMRCEELLDDREEVVARLLLQRPRELEASLCTELAGVCTGEQLGLKFQPPIDPIVASGAQKLDMKIVKVKPEL